MNIDFVAILNAAITESVGTLVTQQLAFIVKPIEDMASKFHELTVRVTALEDQTPAAPQDSRNLMTEVLTLQRDVAIHDEHLKLLGAGLGERVVDHMNAALLSGEGRFAQNLEATLNGAIDEALDNRDWTVGSVGSAIDAAVNGAIEDVDFGQKVEDVLNAGRLDVTFRS